MDLDGSIYQFSSNGPERPDPSIKGDKVVLDVPAVAESFCLSPLCPSCLNFADSLVLGVLEVF